MLPKAFFDVRKDTRSKKSLASVVKDAAGQYSIGNIIGKTHTVGDGQIHPEKGKKVLIMDEVDGMAGNEDRGGIAGNDQSPYLLFIPMMVNKTE